MAIGQCENTRSNKLAINRLFGGDTSRKTPINQGTSTEFLIEIRPDQEMTTEGRWICHKIINSAIQRLPKRRDLIGGKSRIGTGYTSTFPYLPSHHSNAVCSPLTFALHFPSIGFV